jgi:DNA-binding Lrp family transcriptional regulator
VYLLDKYVVNNPNHERIKIKENKNPGVCMPNRKMNRNVNSHLDDLDLEIIRELQKDSRLSCRSIGKSLHISPGTVSDRIKRLENDGVIRKFTAIIDPLKVGKSYSMFLMVRLEAHYMPSEVVKKIEGLDESCCIHNISGEYDLHLLIRATDNKAAAELIDKIRAIEGVNQIESYVILRSFKAFYDVPV